MILTCVSESLPATPLIALKEANNCAGCHKGGRGQKPVLLRRCTLDCQGCHIDPAGGGPRNQWGYYYTHTGVGSSTLNFFEPQDPLQDKSRWDAHVDMRTLNRRVGGETHTFPMSLSSAIRIRPFVEYLHLTYNPTLFGKENDDVFRIITEGDRGFREWYSVMVDQIPLNTYVRAYKGAPMYGIRRPNHSLWIRERVGLDQFATTQAVEFGTNPNVPYFRASYMTGDPYMPEELRQKGMSYHAGMRGVTLGWHVNTSGWSTQSDRSSVDMHAFGAGMNVFGILLYAEKNWRTVEMDEELQTDRASGSAGHMPLKVQPSSTIAEYTAAASWIPGVMFGTVYETFESDYHEGQRRNFFLDLHLIPFVQLEFWQREETGDRNLSDVLASAHFYLDF